jgi:hypothetical protein
MNIRKYFLPTFLIIEVIYVWYGLYQAQFYEYDDNFGVIINCFLVSFVTLIALVVLWFYKRPLFKQNAVILLIWFLLASPLTIFIAVTNYEAIFKKGLSL